MKDVNNRVSVWCGMPGCRDAGVDAGIGGSCGVWVRVRVCAACDARPGGRSGIPHQLVGVRGAAYLRLEGVGVHMELGGKQR